MKRSYLVCISLLLFSLTGFQITNKSAFFGPVLKFDHPFIATIHDNQTNTLLFLQTVTNPLIESSNVMSTSSPRSSLNIQQSTNQTGAHGHASDTNYLHFPLLVLTLILKSLINAIMS